MIGFKMKGNFNKTSNYLNRLSVAVKLNNLDTYAKQGVDALMQYTPKRTGKTAASWYYKITRTNDTIRMTFHNDNMSNEGIPIAILIQYGHGTGTGAYVQGVDYINPALTPIFNSIAKDAWEEVTRL